MKRRALLGLTASVGVSALVGCGTPKRSVAPPSPPQQRLSDGGWSLDDESVDTLLERRVGDTTVTASSHTLRYVDEDLRERARHRSLGQVDAPVGRFFVTRVRFDPALSTFPPETRDRLLTALRSAAGADLTEWLEADGLTDVRKSGETGLERGGDVAATMSTFAATLPVSDVTVEVPPHGDLTLELDDLDVAGGVAVWTDEDGVVVTGGTRPTGNVASAADKQLSQGMSMQVKFDLGVDPAARRAELRDLLSHTA